MKNLKIAQKILNDSKYSTKIKIYFATKQAGDDFDEYEQNYIFANLNPITIKGYVRDINPEALVWKQYGLQHTGAKEIICESRYKTWFEKCNKIVIDNEDYQVFKEGTGAKNIIIKRPYNMLKVVVTRKE